MNKPIRKFSFIFLLAFFFLHCISTISLAITSSGPGSQWLQQNLMKPVARPAFTVAVTKSMLDTQGREKASSIVDYAMMTDDALYKEIKARPLAAEPYIQLNQRYQRTQHYERANEVLSSGLKVLFAALDKDKGNWQLGREMQKIYRSVHQQEKAKKMAIVFLKNNPDNVDTLLDLAKIEILAADFPAARTYINKAYSLSPRSTDVYLVEFLYQLNSGQVEIAKTGLSDSVTWPVSTKFFSRAMQENPGLVIPETALHGLQVIQVFYSAILRNIDVLSSKQPFDFVLDVQLALRLGKGKEYFTQFLDDDRIDSYFAHLCLLMAAIVENDNIASNRLYGKLSTFPEVDNEMYRLMIIGDLAKAQFSEAIQHLNASIDKHDNIQDRLMLAYLYEVVGNAAASLQILLEYKGQLSLEMMVNRLGYSILANDPEKVQQLYDEYKGFRQLWRNPDFVYYALVVEALQGKTEEMREIEKLLPPDSDWSRSAAQISRHLLGTKVKMP